jgi:hypothetical protein
MTDAYEQIRIELADVEKTAFASVFGTFMSHTMQQGDCNAPATFQRLMTWIYQEHIGDFIQVYLDDIFIFLDSIKQHEIHIRVALDIAAKPTIYQQVKTSAWHG